MNIYIVSIFPEIFDGFIKTSLIGKAIKNKKIKIKMINPRDFSDKKNKQIDDEIYGGGDGMLIQAKPIIDAVNAIIKKVKGKFKIVYMCPSENILDQSKCFEYSKIKDIIIICGRYEGIDYRFEQYFMDKYPKKFERLSIGKYVLMGGEVGTMVFMESVGRLVSGIIQKQSSYEDESYNIDKDMLNIEYPQFTRPQDVYGYDVPKVFLNGNHKEIQKWRDDFEKKFKL